AHVRPRALPRGRVLAALEGRPHPPPPRRARPGGPAARPGAPPPVQGRPVRARRPLRGRGGRDRDGVPSPHAGDRLMKGGRIASPALPGFVIGAILMMVLPIP